MQGPRSAIRARAVITIIVASTCAFASTLAGGAVRADAVTSTPRVELATVADLRGTTALAVRARDPTLYVAEQSGRVRAIRDGRLVRRAVLDLERQVTAGGERGLLGLAFSPDGSHLYVDYTDRDGNSRIDEFAMEGRTADPGSQRAVLEVDQPQPNHNGGQLAFGPDGYLYIGFGDGGAGGDQGPGHASGGNGQSLETLLGKILRIDPQGAPGRPYAVPTDNPFVGDTDALPEIWAYGLRNPWRFSFDATSGDLWIGDVGQNAWEEIDFAAAEGGRDAGRGANFGWNIREGAHEYRGRPSSDLVDPIYEMSHDDGACSITGGFVYRGSAIPELEGMYVFTDYCRGELLALTRRGASDARVRNLGIEMPTVSSFGEGPDRELYVLSQSTGIYKLVRR
jgi:glucose/arabinose dehydrogenase